MAQVDALHTKKRTKVIALFFGTLFFVLFGASKLYGLMRDGTCFKYLGCNSGFFGYDGLLHFVFGIAFAGSIYWFLSTYPTFYTPQDVAWKNFLVFCAVVVLVGFIWETIEFGYDHVRMIVFHINLIQPNQMAQPSNSDTMGDMALGFLGALLGGVLCGVRNRLYTYSNHV